MYYRTKTKSRTKSRTKSNNMNNIIDYKSIFSYNRKNDKSIIFLKKTEFDIFYSCKYKYPILVKETITSQTGNPELNGERIDRSKLIDPFMEDIELPILCRHTLEDYDKYMAYGVSMGHNAPAGQHKTNINVFNETFLLSNITPQEMVFNSGLWALMENWCKKLGENKKLYDITIFTGSIPSNKNINFKNVGVSMNIPQKMFKIVCFKNIVNPNITFMEILIANNSPYFINPKIINYDISPYLVPVKSWNWFQNFTSININKLLLFYGFEIKNIKPFRTKISLEIHLHRLLKLLMHKSNWYGYLIYAKNIKELDKKWEECKLQNFENIYYHQEFYERVKLKLIKESKESKQSKESKENIFSISSINYLEKYKKTFNNFNKNKSKTKKKI
jgi:DNA/RNA endonuclease G (NUC1)